MSEDQPLMHNEIYQAVPIEEKLPALIPIEIDPSVPLREEADFKVVAEIATNGESMDTPIAKSFMLIDLDSAPSDKHGNKWFQGTMVHSSVRFMLVDSDLHQVDAQRNVGFRNIRAGETVNIGRAEENFAERFNIPEDVLSYVSRDHFSVTLLDNGKLQLEDKGSSNGTRVRFGTREYDEDLEITHRKKPESGERQLTKVAIGEVIEGKKDPCEDTILNSEEYNLFGIFDGAGGHGNGDRASKLAADKSLEHIIHISPDATDEQVRHSLVNALKSANVTVMNEANGGVTTGTITKIGELDGQKYAAWASVGDSPIMIFNRETGTLTRLSRDEILSPERANVIVNAIGDRNMDVYQSGIIQMQPGDEIIICSDGITGDYAPDILSDAEIIQAMQSHEDPQQAARALLRISRKSDDKAVLVLR